MPTDVLKDLQKAEIYEVDYETGEKIKEGAVVCMFNPAEYTVSKTNTFKETTETQKNAPKADFITVGSQVLNLNLLFDTYELGEDVSEKTRLLWKFMKPKENTKSEDFPKGKPPEVAFEWGVFRFRAYITSLSQQFTLFTHQGVPVRAKVTVSFTQYEDPEDYQKLKTNPTSGGGLSERLWHVVAGDRLDNIAARIYQDASKWRRIAEHNHLMNPLTLRPGMLLRIPMD